MSNFPTSIDDSSTLPNPIAGNFTTAPDHAVLHSTENDAIKALEAKLGTGVSTATSSTLLRGTGAGTTAFAQANLTTDVTGILPAANGGIGTTTGTGNTVRDTSPTIVTPTIASFANANHTHQNSAGGGTLAEAALAMTDITTNDVSISKHGFTPKAPNDTTKFLRGDASWSVTPYTLQAYLVVTAPADATTYFAAYGQSNATTASFGRFYIPRSGTVTFASVSVLAQGTVGTTETSTMSLRLNDTTDTTISSAVVASTGNTFYSNSVSIAVVAGDFLNLKWVTPTWATNPGVVAINVVVFIT